MIMKVFMLYSMLVIAAVGYAPEVLAQSDDARATVAEAFVPVAVEELLHARPFTLETPYKYMWCKEQPEIKRGTVVVVKVRNDLARPRQSAMPVLFVNGRPAEQTNVGFISGHLVAIVPGKIDLSRARIYHGTPQLPEQVDAAKGKAEMRKAIDAGIRPFPRDRVEQALRNGGETVAAKQMADIYATVVADLITRYSPNEAERADGYRLWLNK